MDCVQTPYYVIETLCTSPRDIHVCVIAIVYLLKNLLLLLGFKHVRNVCLLCFL